MKKIVFCNIAYMKYYQGITDDDKPVNGGSYVEENGDGAESCNFLPNNHFCYGYVAARGNLNLKRVDKSIGSDTSAIEGVTVIWVANRKIVGWYENAKMYSQMQEFYDDILGDDKSYWLYNFEAHEEDAWLLPVELRDFDIPSAPTAGTGKGMGQSNIWYADSVYAREEFVPKVIKYIEEVRDDCIQHFWTDKDITEKAQYSNNFTVEQLLKRALKWKEAGKFIEALKIYNLIETKITKPQDICVLKFLRGNMLQSILLYDEAVELYKQFLFDFEHMDEEEKSVPLTENLPDLQATYLDCLWCLASTYMAEKEYFQACSLYQKYLDLESDIELKCYALWRLMYIFNEEGDFKHLAEIINAYEKLNTDFIDEDVEYFKENLRDIKKN